MIASIKEFEFFSAQSRRWNLQVFSLAVGGFWGSILVHYNDNVLDSVVDGEISIEWESRAREDKFRGFAKKGEKRFDV